MCITKRAQRGANIVGSSHFTAGIAEILQYEEGIAESLQYEEGVAESAQCEAGIWRGGRYADMGAEQEVIWYIISVRKKI